jgi:hypothetical protein
VTRRRREKPDHRRTAVADEAARIMQEQGLRDFRSAKAKALVRLGLEDHGAMPSNEEIEQALTARNRIFLGEAHGKLLDQMRRAALRIMQLLEDYQPRLVGSVLNGSATAHSSIELHALCDTVEAVGATLDAIGIPQRAVQRRLRFRRDEVENVPGLRFQDRGFDFDVTVFPERSRGHSPLSVIDGRPMRRAGAREVSELLEPKD